MKTEFINSLFSELGDIQVLCIVKMTIECQGWSSRGFTNLMKCWSHCAKNLQMDFTWRVAGCASPMKRLPCSRLRFSFILLGCNGGMRFLIHVHMWQESSERLFMLLLESEHVFCPLMIKASPPTPRIVAVPVSLKLRISHGCSLPFF